MSTVVLTAGLVAQATGGRLITGSPLTPFGSVSTDSRAIQPGALFIALKGDRYDGHAFVGDALAAGASGFLLAADMAESAGAGLAAGAAAIVVQDTLTALQRKAQLAQWKGRARAARAGDATPRVPRPRRAARPARR